MRIQVLLPLLGIILITVFICRLHRPLPAPVSAPQETIAPSRSMTLKNENHPKSENLNAVAEAVPSLTLEKLSRQTTIANIIADIRQALNSTNEADQKEIITRLFPTLLSLDPAAAADLAQNVESVPLREELFRQVARVWSQTDPKKAVEWASNLDDLSEREN